MAPSPAEAQDLLRPPDGALGQNVRTYSESLKTNIKWDSRLKRNVLEIFVESDSSSYVDIPDSEINRLFTTIGIDVRSQVEGYFRRGNKIFAWLANGIDLNKFCRAEAIRINKDVKTRFIRPAGKKEVSVKNCGLDFNTPDSYVLEYIKKFGRVVSDKVIYDKYKEGPFTGKYNGDRKYSVDFTNSRFNMGTFHIIDGARVKIFYIGNRKTCARCHLTADHCPGEAQAVQCEELGGSRVPLVEHMKKLWEIIDFRPVNFELDIDDIELETKLGGDVQISDKTTFSPTIKRPAPTEEDINKYAGIVISNFPLGLAKADVIKFLKKKGLPGKFDSEKVVLSDSKKCTNVEICPLESDSVKTIMSKIHFIETKTKFFERPLYCRAVRDLSPLKALSKDGDPEVSCNKNKDVVLSPNKNDPDYDFINIDTMKKTPSSKLFRNADCSSTEDDSDNEKETSLNHANINNINLNKRERNSSGKKKNGKKHKK